MVIKKLAKQFRSHGVHYQQIERQGDVALFSLRYGDNTPVIGYDVAKVQSTPLERYNGLIRDLSRKIQGNPDDVVESYPSSRQWGQCAWSYTTLPAARSKYWQLIEQEKRKTLEMVSGWKSRKEPSYAIGM